jgi:gamma-glutamylcyclotransferase (GGCT)/AIG2-like uncharacterized protein YtfP
MTCPALFVYGSLRRDTGHEMQVLLANSAEFIGYATFQAKLYLIDGYPGAIPSSCPDDLVHGEVYQLSDPDLLLQQLDEYEECGLGFPELTEYSRAVCEIWLTNGKALPAWVYLYNRPAYKLELIPSGNFIDLEKG